MTAPETDAKPHRLRDALLVAFVVLWGFALVGLVVYGLLKARRG